MKNLLLFMGMILSVSFTIAQTPTDLFFSEYCEGSGNNKGVEIYNPTDQPIDLSNYFVARFSNGSSVFTEGGYTQLQGMLEPYKTYVLVNGQTVSTPTSPACSPEMQALADQLDHDYPAPTYMNGNDAIALIKTPGGVPPTQANMEAVDLIGEIGLGNEISNETGWSYVQDSTLTYNNSNGDPVTGRVINYIVQSKADDGQTYGPYWMSWTSDHTLIRKPEVVSGVVGNPDPFKVKQQWDTLPGVVDTATGFIVYKDIWTNLGTHKCVADPNYNAGIEDIASLVNLNIYPNPVVAGHFSFKVDVPVVSVQVYTITGKEINKEVFDGKAKEATVEIGSGDKGIYLVKFSFEDNRETFQKIIVK